MVKAEGILAHKFHGTYFSVIALSFQDEQCARDALSILGDSWKVGQKNATVLVWSGDRDSLESVKSKLKGYGLQIKPCTWRHCKDHCKSAEIDGLPHSIDYGPAFTVEIPTTAKEQTSLFG